MGRSNAARRRLLRARAARARRRRTVQEAPNDEAVWIHLATSQRALGKIHDAITSVQRALEADPRRKKARRLLADLFVDAGEPEQAIAIYEEVTHLDPTTRSASSARRSLGACLARVGEREAALEQLRILQTMEPVAAARLTRVLKVTS